jgi:uncharacterized membrane protein (UPF0127 family)
MNMYYAAFAVVAVAVLAVAFFLLMKTPVKFCFGSKCFGGGIADNPFKKAFGLMLRDSIPEDYGMVFPMKGMNASFWMKNVKFPLELVCVKGGKVTEIIVMETCGPNGCARYAPNGEIDYAVETNVGFCARNGVREGTEFMIQ